MAGFFEGKRSLWLLTHHQPVGWSPALAKGGYTLGPAPVVFSVQAQQSMCLLSGFGRGDIPSGWRLLLFQRKGVSPYIFYPPFARAGDRCACAMVVG